MNQSRRRFASALLLAASAVAIPTLSSTAHAASPLDTGCPASYEALSVAWLATQGPYMLPAQYDAAGNGDGIVCGKRVSDAATAALCGVPCAVPVYYLFTDNTRTSLH